MVELRDDTKINGWSKISVEGLKKVPILVPKIHALYNYLYPLEQGWGNPPKLYQLILSMTVVSIFKHVIFFKPEMRNVKELTLINSTKAIRVEWW